MLRCLEKDPATRFADVADLARALRRCGCADEAPTPGPRDSVTPTMAQGMP